jgi:hypothetical protein
MSPAAIAIAPPLWFGSGSDAPVFIQAEEAYNPERSVSIVTQIVK